MNKLVINKKRGFSEMPLYRSISMFLVFITPIVNNMQKDIKQTYGYEIVRMTMSTLIKLRRSYYEKKNVSKLLLVNDIYYTIGDVETLFKILFELGNINITTQSNISIQLGDILSQLTGWINVIEKSVENEK